MILNTIINRFFGTLRRRLITGVVLVHAVMMSLFVWDLTSRQERMILDSQIEHATALAQSLATSSAAWLAASDVAGLQELVDSQQLYPELAFSMLTDSRSHILAHSDKSKIGLDVLDMPPTAKLSVISSSRRLVDIAVPAMLAGKQVGWARVGIGQMATGKKLDRITSNGIMYAILAIAAGSMIAWLMGRAFTRRLYEIQKVIDYVKSGDNERRIHLSGNDEAALLAREFDAMLDTIELRETALKNSENKLRESNANLEIMVAARTRVIKESQERLDLAIRSADMGIWSWNMVHDIRYFDDRVCHLLGLNPALFKGTADEFYSAVHPEDRKMIASALSRAIKNNEAYNPEYRAVWPDGSIHHIAARSRMTRDSQGKPLQVNGILWDITEKKKAEAAQLEAREAADRANRAKSEFLANMSHEIRTPLNGVIGLTHLMIDTPLNTTQEEYMRKICSSSRALLDVLNDILDYSKIESGHLGLEDTLFCLDDLLTNVTDLFSVLADEKGLLFTFNISDNIPRYYQGDPLRLGQVLNNLVGNAIKFSDHGEIHISITACEQTSEDILLAISVKDTGIGIPEEIQGNLFKAFSQADSSTTRKYGGTGLGLVISKKIVALMGGEIGVESRAGEGSTFRFTVRLKTASQTEKGAVQKVLPMKAIRIFNEKASLIQGARVLLVEDKPINQVVARELLKKMGLDVVTANNGKEAVEICGNGDYDIILMDLQMPEMDGFEAAEIIRSMGINSQVPIIAMTAAAMDKDKEACLMRGMSDHISKPIDPENLLNTLLKWIKPRSKDLFPIVSDKHGTGAIGVPFELKSFDLEEAVQRTAGNWMTLKKILKIFVSDFTEAAKDLERFITSGQIPEALRLIHNIKGISGNLGAKELYDAAIHIEDQLLTGTSPSLSTFEQLLASSVETINTCKELNEQTPPPAVFDPEVIMNCLSQITEIMEEHRIIPRNLMASLRSMLSESHAAHLLVKFEREVERFDYQDGLETILIITEHMNNKLNDPAQTQRHISPP